MLRLNSSTQLFDGQCLKPLIKGRSSTSEAHGPQEPQLHPNSPADQPPGRKRTPRGGFTPNLARKAGYREAQLRGARFVAYVWGLRVQGLVWTWVRLRI